MGHTDRQLRARVNLAVVSQKDTHISVYLSGRRWLLEGECTATAPRLVLKLSMAMPTARKEHEPGGSTRDTAIQHPHPLPLPWDSP